MPTQPPPDDRDTELAPLAPIALVLGLAMIVTGLVAVVEIPRWTVDYGVMVVAAGFLYVGVAARLVHWGVGQLRNRSGD
ncbi:hypothetical protein IU459_07090 [Nocardia amamiensis]|uniref:DUF2530 domain-containing protein n=1 Tax=Nocardia amamiensis TaxID=404578 RepID=A0ABS0CL16_9NOCA|nr:hypothetical protein [Nocardia amamiensis]MBF6297310.1 hypothetical protein [Nocardia amamiensis]